MLKLRSADPFVALHHAASPAASPAISRAGLPTSGDELLAARDQPPVPYGSDPTATPLFLLRGGGGKPRPWIIRNSDGTERVLSKALRIGTAPDNDWVLSDRYVSQHHVQLVPGSDGVQVQDRGSRNGTYVNGVRVRHGELRQGGTLRLGETELRLLQPVGSGLLGQSAKMMRLREQITRFAPSLLPVLVLGESGTGKELVAKALHTESARRGPLITVNCGALARELIESELFGHERGAFTGAERRHLGCFGEAAGGTLFLDEIGELPLELQPRLLRALENRAIRPIGSGRELPIDVRIVAATHRDLSLMVTKGQFRQDLFYRLAGLTVELPPLRSRRDDIPLLIAHFVAEAASELPGLQIADEEIAALSQASWPGNVRELKMALLRTAHLHGPVLRAKDVLAGQRLTVRCDESQVPILGRRLADIERDVLTTVLRHTQGNQRAAAAILDLPKSSLSDRLRRLGIHCGRSVVQIDRQQIDRQQIEQGS